MSNQMTVLMQVLHQKQVSERVEYYQSQKLVVLFQIPM